MASEISPREMSDRLGTLDNLSGEGPVESSVRDARSLAKDLHLCQLELEATNRTLRELRLALEDSRERYSRLYDLAPIGYVTLSEGGIVEEANLTAARMLGCWRDDLLGMPFFSIAGVADESVLLAHLARCARERKTENIEVRAHPNESTGMVVLRLSSTPILEPGGRLVVLAAMTDVTKQEADREVVRDIVMQAPVPVLVCRGPAHTIVMANRLSWPLVGGSKPPDRAIGDLVGSARERLVAILDEVQRSGGQRVATEVPFLYVSENGEADSRLFDVTAQAVRFTRGGRDAIVVIGIDVTQRVRARDAMDRAREAADSANRMKDDFLGLVSHELRTPLNAILGWSHTLTKQRAPDAVLLQRGLQVMRRNAEALAHLVEDILDVSRIISGKLRVELRSVDLGAIVRDVIEGLRPAAEGKGIAIESFLDADSEVVGDAERLRQVVSNLVTNAIKFTPHGGEIRVRVGRSGDSVRLTIRDTGRGIAPNALPHVFDRFRQVDSSTARSHSGLGIGLTIVRHIVEAHRGSVSADSEGLNRGATFTVDLPPKRASMPPPPWSGTSSAPPPLSSRLLASDGPSLAGMCVLVVDDDPDTLDVTSVTLGGYGADVRSARSANEALAMLNTFTPDVLVSDLAMPEKDGYTFIAEVRALDRPGARVPAIALTAQARPEDARRALREGFQQHVSKPDDPDELAEAVAALIDQRLD
jgi:PAS domain S-box-containing protein